MSRETDPRYAWWFDLDQGSRDELDRIARRSILDGLPGYPFWDHQLCADVVAWQQLENEVTAAHCAWLEGVHHRAIARGRPWDHHELLRQSRLAGDLTCPPPHLTGEEPW